jgi:hypothetical protein
VLKVILGKCVSALTLFSKRECSLSAEIKTPERKNTKTVKRVAVKTINFFTIIQNSF